MDLEMFTTALILRGCPMCKGNTDLLEINAMRLSSNYKVINWKKFYPYYIVEEPHSYQRGYEEIADIRAELYCDRCYENIICYPENDKYVTYHEDHAKIVPRKVLVDAFLNRDYSGLFEAFYSTEEV